MTKYEFYSGTLTRGKILFFTIVVFVGLSLMCSCEESNSNSEKADKVIKLIEENLQHGTPFADVESYLKKTQVEYSYDNETKQFTGIVRDVSKKGFVSTNISVIIEMDEQGKLKDLETKIIHTGL